MKLHGSAAANISGSGTSSAVPLKCLNPRCQLLVHTSGAFEFHCCGRCRHSHAEDHRRTKHGPMCEGLVAPQGTPRPILAPKPPSIPPTATARAAETQDEVVDQPAGITLPSGLKLYGPPELVNLVAAEDYAAPPPLSTDATIALAAPRCKSSAPKPKFSPPTVKRLRVETAPTLAMPTRAQLAEEVQQCEADATLLENEGCGDDAARLRFRALVRSCKSCRGPDYETIS